MNAYKSHIVRLLLIALTVLPALTSCYDYGEEGELQNSDNVNYINVTVAVSTSNGAMTRANMPLGGEDGDGNEKGIDTRENYVKGVTLIFYRDVANTTAGINATEVNAQNTTIDHVVYYFVERDDNVPANHHLPGEVYYTTGDQQLSPSFRVDKKYRMLVVANANLTNMITPGVTTLAQVREMTLKKAYEGTGFSTDASEFVMSSEEAPDYLIDFSDADYDNTVHRRTLRLDRVHIERMAARIDFLAKNGKYTTDEYSTGSFILSIPVSGYEYTIGTNDHFVLTRVIPFNLNMGSVNASGDEYLFKRTNDATAPYLADETTDNWVVDPYASQKISTQTSHFAWTTNPLTNVETQMSTATNIVTLNPITLASPEIQTVKQSVGGYADFIVAYPKENTLKEGSLLYYNATGIAFEGYYFHNGSHASGVRKVYYHYLRHQGESSSAYQALQSPLSKDAACGATPAMNFGVVRNNIYRIEISSLTEEVLNLKIKVKKWDKFEHDVIYM